MRREVALTVVCLGLAWACGDDATEADRLGVGAECSSDEDCQRNDEADISLACLRQFKGGYCGLQDCRSNDDCPAPSSCVAHDDGNNYCFRTCAEKSECNVNRGAASEANCSSNVDYVEDGTSGKSCVPPSG